MNNNTTTLVKPVATLSLSPSNIEYNGNSSPPREHNSVSSGSDSSGFIKVGGGNIEHGATTSTVSSERNAGYISHNKMSAFMNWIPIDRSSDYIGNVFKTLRITNDASILMKSAFDRKMGSSHLSKRDRPHNIAYITIPADSIINSIQGEMFIKGIQSEQYQIILDCGDELHLSKWQYRVYPTKKKLLPTEIPAFDLPQLGVITITMEEANITTSYPPPLSSQPSHGVESPWEISYICVRDDR